MSIIQRSNASISNLLVRRRLQYCFLSCVNSETIAVSELEAVFASHTVQVNSTIRFFARSGRKRNRSIMSETTRSNPMILGSYAVIGFLWVASQITFIPYVAHLLILVTAILYAACHKSLILLEDVPAEGEEGYDPDMKRETMKKEDAYQFPLVGSMALFSLYMSLKYLGPELVNLLIGFYFGMVGCVAMTVTMAPFIAGVCPKAWSERRIGWDYKLNHPLPSWILAEPIEFKADFSPTDILSFVMSIGIIYFYFQKKYWPLNNVIGICFCLQGVERFSLGTYKIGAILLVGLFFYDIFWVFGTEVMVSVAKNIDGPIKILFPRSLVPNAETGKIELSLLGLGDIVIPGFFLALLLRFDAHMAGISTREVNIDASCPKPYFHSALFAYVLGLVATLFVMIQFNAAQPALLYLVPACLGSSFLCATVRGEVKALLDYSEEEDEGEDSDAKKED